MNQNSKPNRGMNAYLIMMALILLFFVIVSYFTSSNQSYTYQDMENVLELDNVSAATLLRLTGL